MKRHANRKRPAGYTLAELSIVMGVLTIIGGLAYSMLMSSTNLLAKNVSLNSSNIVVREALDRLYADLNQANSLPVLIDANGKPTGTAAPAAGILVDRYLGGPYIVGNPGAGLPAATTTFKLFYSDDPPLAKPPDPARNDVVVMNNGATRALVDSCTFSLPSAPGPSPLPNPGRMATVTLQNTLGTYTTPPGTPITWPPTAQQVATLTHRQAFVVVPVNGTAGPAELRMYPDAETVANYNDPTKYVVLTRNIGTQTVNGLAENTPFSLVPQNPLNPVDPLNPAAYLKIAVRVEDQQYNNRLATQQANEFNTFLRVDSVFRPKNIPPVNAAP